MQRKVTAEDNVRKAAKDKRAADIAAAEASSEAQEADKEAEQAEKEAEAATKHAAALEAKFEAEQKDAKKSKKHKLRGNPHSAEPETSTTNVQIPLSVVPQTHLAGLLRYLESGINHKMKFSSQEKQLMQSFFLSRGSTLLSALAEVDPDATWHSKGVVPEEQYEMDRGHPDQLSREWGSKHLKDDTVVTDFVRDNLWAKRDETDLKRPDGKQTLTGLFGSNHKIGLKFAPDSSQPETKEPDLGEEDAELDGSKAHKGAFAYMMGIN